jgi:hypothetical protein
MYPSRQRSSLMFMKIKVYWHVQAVTTLLTNKIPRRTCEVQSRVSRIQPLRCVRSSTPDLKICKCLKHKNYKNCKATDVCWHHVVTRHAWCRTMYTMSLDAQRSRRLVHSEILAFPRGLQPKWGTSSEVCRVASCACLNQEANLPFNCFSPSAYFTARKTTATRQG